MPFNSSLISFMDLINILHVKDCYYYVENMTAVQVKMEKMKA